MEGGSIAHVIQLCKLFTNFGNRVTIAQDNRKCYLWATCLREFLRNRNSRYIVGNISDMKSENRKWYFQVAPSRSQIRQLF